MRLINRLLKKSNNISKDMFNLYNLEYKKVEDFPEREQRNIVNNENRLNFLKIKYFLNFIFFAVLIGSVLFPVYQANAYLLNASDLVGQLDENNEPIFTKGVANNAPSNTGFNFNGSAAVAIDETGHHLFVSDQGNNRVLIFNLDSNNQLVDRIADYVLGQSTFSTNSAGTTQSGLNFPGGIAYDSVSKRLFVAEYTNNRVSVFDLSGGITNGMDASYVLGQPDFLTKTATTTQSGLSTPFYLAIDSDNQRLFVSDGNNNRVLVFNVAAGTMINNKAADYVLGQLLIVS